LQDNHGRKINYLRLSVTDLCNLRCQYCMPEEGVLQKPHNEILRIEEIEQIVRIAARLGIEKVRITGGEPLVRKGILKICQKIAAVPQIRELCLTTNGILLPQMAQSLADAGVSRVNISLDTLKPAKYHSMTRMGQLSDVLLGIEAAKAAGLSPIKINVVLIGGFNDSEIEDFVFLTQTEDYEVRFIELMPVGPAANWDSVCFVPIRSVLQKVPGLEPVPGNSTTASLYRLPGAKGLVGLISPISQCFCGTCNRIRITADGRFKGCLLSSEEISLRNQSDGALESLLKNGIASKPDRHHLAECPSVIRRSMSQIGG